LKKSDIYKSAEWKALKQRILEKRRRCELCEGDFYYKSKKRSHQRNKRRSELHHRTYLHLGHERDDELVLLCARCHGVITKIHEMAGDTIYTRELKKAILDFFIEEEKYGT
jgi:hypothetical protein